MEALCCSVSDNGTGIPESELEAVFGKFVQSSKTKTGAGGTGLGLAICREIVEAHGGKNLGGKSKAKRQHSQLHAPQKRGSASGLRRIPPKPPREALRTRLVRWRLRVTGSPKRARRSVVLSLFKRQVATIPLH